VISGSVAQSAQKLLSEDVLDAEAVVGTNFADASGSLSELLPITIDTVKGGRKNSKDVEHSFDDHMSAWTNTVVTENLPESQGTRDGSTDDDFDANRSQQQRCIRQDQSQQKEMQSSSKDACAMCVASGGQFLGCPTHRIYTTSLLVAPRIATSCRSGTSWS
jgi:hypothetical protein